MSNAPQPSANTSPVTSTMANDPDMAALVAEFAGEMPLRAAELARCWERNELESVQRLAHQLKGSSGGYGFATVGKAASDVEATLIKLGNGDTAATLERLRGEFNQLVEIVKRVTA